MKYFIITFGCQMNLSDSEKIEFLLQKKGYEPAKNEASADLIVINACSVRQKVMHRVASKINKFSKTKKIILAGCLLPADKQRYEAQIEIWSPDKYFNLSPLRQNKITAFVPIMTGCNNFCSYCAVPFTRGPEKSRPAKEIIDEIKNLIKKGYKEIILLGQNVNSYRSPALKKSDPKIDFAGLLKKIDALPGNFWLNFLTSHPKDMSDKLIKTIAQSKKITPYIHLPIQSGDNEILKKMNRRYKVEDYKILIKKIKSAFKKYRPSFPPPAITTDIIVGFPGETKKQFDNTAKLCQQIGFDMIYFAQYSPRPGTRASYFKDNILPCEKKRRAQIINNILQKTALKNNKKYIGKKVEVLIEEAKNGFLVGKTATGKTVYIKDCEKNKKIGHWIKTKIENATSWGLKGKKLPN